MRQEEIQYYFDKDNDYILGDVPKPNTDNPNHCGRQDIGELITKICGLSEMFWIYS